VTRACLGLIAVCACGLPAPATPSAPERIAIVASERGPRGIRLVAIDEHGDRRFELVAPATTIVQDKNPAVSPDGRWLVFASTRERTDGTSLWIAPLQLSATPRRLTAEPAAIDSHPVWARDGRSIVFASTRDGGDFDLWQLAIDPDGKPGAATTLTTAPGNEVTPSLASDGTIIYASVTQIGERALDSHLEERAPDGTIRALTSGPADSSPAFSPDGATIVFARPALHNGTAHSELWRMARNSELVTQLVDLPLTDESGPVWSPDGRFVFATSALRGADGRTVLFSSVVHVDLREPRPRVRILGDRAGPVARLTPAIPTGQLDVAALHADPEYLPELARIMAAKIAEQTER